MIKQMRYQNITWVDAQSPSPEELTSLTEQYDIHPVIAHELLGPTTRSKVDLYDNCLYLILHFPTYQAVQGNIAGDSDGYQELDFVIGKDFIITTHYEEVPSIAEFAKIFEASSILQKTKKEIHAGYLFYYILQHLYQSLSPALDLINSELKKIEQKTFSGQEQDNVRSLNFINRGLLDFRWALKNHQTVLESLEIAGKEFFGEKFVYYLRSISGEYEKVWNMLESSRETFIELRQTNDSLLTIKTNDIMKILTIMAFVTFPLSLIAGLFGMNTTVTPILGHPYDFWIITGLMLAGVLTMFAFFKHKKWM